MVALLILLEDVGHTHRCRLAFKKKKKKSGKESQSWSRVPETGSDLPIGSDRESGHDNKPR